MKSALATSDRLISSAETPVSSNGRRVAVSTTLLACFLAALPALAQTTIMVDDDFKQYPQALPTIQQALFAAIAGDTILVFPGVYYGTVNIIGHEKDGLNIIAVGGRDEVVLQGDHKLRDGFHLEDVNDVLIQGFTVRDFGSVPTTSTVFGQGINFYLLRAHRNTIRHNRATKSDMNGIVLVDSADNFIEDNVTWDNDPKGAGCGIHMEGSGSARNTIRRNHAYGNPFAGIMIRSAGADNLVLENVVSSNGMYGITHWNTKGTRIEGNLSNQNPGRTTGPRGSPLGLGIDIRTSTGLTIKNNSAFANTGFDFYWDNSGIHKLTDNPGLKSLSALKLSNTTNAGRSTGFLGSTGFFVGDGFRVEVTDAPANALVYLRLFKDGKDLGTTGPYGSLTDSQGRWSFTGTLDANAIGLWYVQAVFGDPEASSKSGIISLTVSKPTS